MSSTTFARNEANADLIRRLEDAETNQLTGRAWPDGHQKLTEFRRQLPVYGQCSEILKTYHENQTFVLSSGTGSGKSTQVTQFLSWDESASGLKIACTQPRRVAAVEVATRVAKEMGCVLGEEVGYHIGGENKTGADNKSTRLVYMTEGVLLNLIKSDELLKDYACVIIDEAHERTIEVDIIMALLKLAMKVRKDLKVVIMSATADATLFQRYFNNCPLVQVEGRNFGIEINHTEDFAATTDYKALAVNVALHIHEHRSKGDILIFLPGETEISAVCRLLRGKDNLDVYPLHGQLSRSKQSKALHSKSAKRKCIVSTNIAETSLTIDGIVYVIDCGLSRQMVYNPRLDMDMLLLRPISQASAKQRTGRAGRQQSGVCYRLYSKRAFNNMLTSTEPAIRCQSFHTAALKLLSMGYNKLVLFDWLDAPPPELMSRAAQDLQDWAMLGDEGTITKPGMLADTLTLHPSWYRAIAEGNSLGCGQDIVDIALLCSSQKPVYLFPPQAHERRNSVEAKRMFQVEPSDHINLATAFNAYMHVRQLQELDKKIDLDTWCDVHYLNKSALETVRLDRLKIASVLQSKKMKLTPSRASLMDTTSVRKALARAFCTHVAMIKSGDIYTTVHEDTRALLDPYSSLVERQCEWVVYTNLSLSGQKPFLRQVTAIEAEWLVDMPYFQDSRLPLRGDGTIRQPEVKESLDAARRRIEARKADTTTPSSAS